MLSPTHVTAAIMAACALTLAACGSSGSSDTTTGATQTVTETVQPTTTATTNANGSVNLTCTVSGLENVQGGQSTVTVTGSNVDPSQADQATCNEARTVVRQATAGGAEEPVNADGFQCTPSVVSTGPDEVSWECSFKGADTATEITMAFQVTYTG